MALFELFSRLIHRNTVNTSSVLGIKHGTVVFILCFRKRPRSERGKICDPCITEATFMSKGVSEASTEI